MSARRPLTDTETHDRLVKAREALGDEQGGSQVADATLQTARRALTILQLGLVRAMEEGLDVNEAVIPADRAS